MLTKLRPTIIPGNLIKITVAIVVDSGWHAINYSLLGVKHLDQCG